MNEQLKNALTKLPELPGIYKMLDVEGKVLYVGKAANLKKRVSSYFSKQITSIKTVALVGQIADIDIVITQNEKEALLLESNFIKALRPKYNVLLRDDKTYPYIHLSQHRFPSMTSYRAKKKPQKGLYFGPFPSGTLVRETLSLLQKLFKLRNCTDAFFNSRSRPCLQYQIKRCYAPCVGYINEETYQKTVEDVQAFLQGKSQAILTRLSKRLHEAAARLDFEAAALLRDQITQLKALQEDQRIVRLTGDVDVVAVGVKTDLACIVCISVRDGQVIANQSFFPQMPATNLSTLHLEQQLFEAFVRHYYLETPEHIPPCIVFNHNDQGLLDCQALLTDLRKKPCRIQTKPRGANKDWLAFAQKNLQLQLDQHRSQADLQKERWLALARLVGLTQPFLRMDCFDISHTQGQATVASCVVFDQTGPSKGDYRQFNIKGIILGDDYAAIEQAVFRHYKRLTESLIPLPQLIIIDGGKGQVKAAQKALTALEVTTIPLIGIAKGPERKAGLEDLFLATDHQAEPFVLNPEPKALLLLQQIRDEAHRFAISAHRKKRTKEGLGSSLLDIEGIGPQRKQALIKAFGGIRGLQQASVEDIAKVPGISPRLAQRIYEALGGDSAESPRH